MSNAIQITNLVKYYNDKTTGLSFTALDNLSLTIKKGAIFGLLGPNGAGKSTMINILAGTVLKSSGVVKIMDYDIDQYPKTARTLIGIVPQEIVIDHFFSIKQLLFFSSGYYGLKKNDDKIDQILKDLSLYDQRNKRPRYLSGGMKRRFLIAKAVVHSPKVLVLDEPTAGVDIELRNQLWNYIKILNKEGVTIIITTHYLAEAEELCDNIAFINHGKIIKNSTKNNLLNNLGSRELEIEFYNNLDVKKIQNIFNETQVIADNRVKILLDKKDKNFIDLLIKIQKVAAIKDLRINQPNLEDIFYKIINN